VALQLLSTAPALPVKARAHAETPTSTALLDSQRNNSRLSAGALLQHPQEPHSDPQQSKRGKRDKTVGVS
jgi:hypothetical protein